MWFGCKSRNDWLKKSRFRLPRCNSQTWFLQRCRLYPCRAVRSKAAVSWWLWDWWDCQNLPVSYSLRLCCGWEVWPWCTSTLGTPTEDVWPGVTSHRDFKSSFPKWQRNYDQALCNNLNKAGLELLDMTLIHDSARRISDKQAYNNRYFEASLHSQATWKIVTSRGIVTYYH